MKKIIILFITLVAFYIKTALARIPPVLISVTARDILEENPGMSISHFIFGLSIITLLLVGRMLQPWVVGLLTLSLIVSSCFIWGIKCLIFFLVLYFILCVLGSKTS